MANQRSSLRRSKSSISLIPRITATRPSDEGLRPSTSAQPKGRLLFASETKLRRTNSSTSLRGSIADGARPSSVGRLSKQPTTPLTLHPKTPIRQSSVKKDTRPVNDKKWQSDQHLKVKGFFADQPTILNNLKPMTINSFVDAINALFGCIDDRISLSVTNYKEQVPLYMKYLGYPATISPSLLKCVNTLHTWPQVIAILSWLIDFVNNICYSTVPIEYIHGRGELHEPIEIYLLQRYIAWNQGRNEDEVDRQFASEVYQLYDFDENRYLELERRVQNLEPQLAKHKQTDDELTKKIAALQNVIQTKREEISAFRNVQKIPVEEKRQQWLQQIERIDKAITENRENIAELNAIIAKQPCTLEEFEAKKQDIIVLKHNLQLQKEKVEKWIEIISDCDYKLTDTKQKLDRAILDQNLSVMKWEHLNPEMKNLEIQITRYAQIKNEIARVTQLREDYYQKFITELNDARKKLEDTIATHKHLKKKTEVLKDDAEKTKQLQEKLDVEVDQYEFETDVEIKSLLKTQETLTEENTGFVKQKLELSKQIEVLQEDIAIKDKEIKDENASTIEMQKETLNFFVQLHNSIMQNFMKLYELKQGVQNKMKEVMQKKDEDRFKALELMEELARDLSH